MYFGDNIRLKKKSNGSLLLAFRVGERKVEEHRIDSKKLGEIFNLKENVWVGTQTIRSKKTSSGVMIKIAVNVYRYEIYCFTLSEFRFLKSLYLSLTEEQ